MEISDVAIVGGGPAGATCSAFCARAGLRTLLLEREKFPREKVCGDCLNPACWPVLERLEISGAVRELPHGRLTRVDFIGINGRIISVPLPKDAEIAVKRSLFDELLLKRARQLGVETREEVLVTGVSKNGDGSWDVIANEQTFRARVLVAADGRNSTVARLLGLLPQHARERVGLQAHIPLPKDFGDRVVLQFLRDGYSGQAPVGEGQLNLCLVGKPSGLETLKEWARDQFQLPADQSWRTITPLRRRSIGPAEDGLFLIGDAAQVVEPFTGEGIAYALQSGDLAACAIAKAFESNFDDARRFYATEHARLYRGRLWINQLARSATLSPQLSSLLISMAGVYPPFLRGLTRRIVQLPASLDRVRH